MALDISALLERLAAHQLQVVAPAISDPKIAQAVGVTGMLLQQAAREFDEAPGRYRRRGEDMKRLISTYVQHSASTPLFVNLLDASVDSDRLSSLDARDLELQAALIEVAAAIEEEPAIWAVKLRQDIRTMFLRWTN